MGMMVHEEWILQGTVHELAHRLWEELGGRLSVRGRWRRQMRLAKHRLAAEGFAIYAERNWFRDAYPPPLRKRLATDHVDESDFYIKGLRAVEEVVSRLGPDVLLKLPRKWKKLMILTETAVRSAF